MLTLLKNTTKLKIQNVICFYVGFNKHISTAEELNDKKEEDWSYEDYLVASCDKHKYNLIWFNKATVNYSFENNVLNIDDEITNSHISLGKDNVHDTIIFQGQANDDMDINYEGLMRAFEYMGFFMLNTVDEIKLASDKYLSANLLSAHNIPQPRYVLITRDLMEDMQSDTKDTRETFWKLIDQVYVNNTNVNDYTSPDTKYVCKILGGSLGIGVFICTRSEIEGILQAMFQLKHGAQFIVQEFKKNTGDIRVHLLSVDGANYEVLACMKRNKIAKDFRSNVSLGATTDKYKLNEEQEKIVMKTAAASGCRWVGVDLMECEDGSNVVIEYNSSPGVQGISQQIGKNMFDVVFDKINKYLKKFATFTKKGERVEENSRTCYTIYDPEIVDELKLEWNELSEKRIALLNECLKIQPGMFYELHGKENPETGLDCSGYIKYVAKESIGASLPSMCVKYFNTFEENEFEPIDESELQPGDIGVKNESTIMNHCGIYAGNGKWFEETIVYGAQLTDCTHFKHFFRIKNIDEDITA